MNQLLSGPRFRALHTEIVEKIEAGELPSVSIGAIHNGQVLWRESIGSADVEKNLPATPNTPYGLASLGKSITASAVMVLVDRLEVNLNAPISQYIAEDSLTVFDGEKDQLSVRRVLNMTGAIPHGHMVFNSPADLETYPIETLVSNRGLVVFPPGEVYLYSNFAYAVLEKLIQDVSGMPFHEFLQAELFDPLDMKNSFVNPDKHIEINAPVTGYNEDGSRLPPLNMLPRNSLAIFASLNDLINYAKFHLSVGDFIRPPFSNKTLEKMHDLRGEAPGALIALGMASVDLDEDRYWLLTNGRAGGMQATLSMIPSDGLAVICLVNATGRVADDLAFRITDLLLPGFLDRAIQIIGHYEAWADRPYQPSEDLLGDWRGTIEACENRIPIWMAFHQDGRIYAAIGGGSENILENVGYRDGLLSGELLAVVPMEEAQYTPHKITLSLRWKDDQLSGIVTSEIKNAKGSFSLAGYVHLTRSEEPYQETVENSLIVDVK